ARKQGKARFYGINGLGETAALRQAIGLGGADAIRGTNAVRGADTVQACLNLINPTVAVRAPAGFPFQDYEQLIDRAVDQRMGVIAIRVLAAGALSGSPDRVPNAAPQVAPIGTSTTYVEDIAMAQRFSFLVEEGFVSSLVEAAIRFAIGQEGVSTALVGISNIEQLEQAIAFANRGPLPIEALNRLPAIWTTYTTGSQGGT
ncbi:MAG: aldo/keto reductase, partial [Anaerolineae bacterium]|nr:aldo/keto reductase [Anaerolineae bacterium]